MDDVSPKLRGIAKRIDAKEILSAADAVVCRSAADLIEEMDENEETFSEYCERHVAERFADLVRELRATGTLKGERSGLTYDQFADVIEKVLREAGH